MEAVYFSFHLAGGIQWPRGTFLHILLSRYEVIWRGREKEATGKGVCREVIAASESKLF